MQKLMDIINILSGIFGFLVVIVLLAWVCYQYKFFMGQEKEFKELPFFKKEPEIPVVTHKINKANKSNGSMARSKSGSENAATKSIKTDSAKKKSTQDNYSNPDDDSVE